MVHGTKYEIPFRLGCLGLRRSEICALTKKDLKGNILTVHKALVLNSDNKFVEKMLDNIDINSSINSIQKEVKSLQNNLRKMQQSGITLYPNQGSSIDLLERTYNRINSKKGH